MSVQMSSPAPARSTTVSATSPAINPCLRRMLPPPMIERLAMEDRRSTLLVASAGSMPNNTLVNKESESVKASTRPSRESRPAVFHRQPFNHRWRQHSPQTRINRRGGCADGGASGGGWAAHPHAHPPGDHASWFQPERSDD